MWKCLVVVISMTVKLLRPRSSELLPAAGRTVDLSAYSVWFIFFFFLIRKNHAAFSGSGTRLNHIHPPGKRRSSQQPRASQPHRSATGSRTAGRGREAWPQRLPGQCVVLSLTSIVLSRLFICPCDICLSLKEFSHFEIVKIREAFTFQIKFRVSLLKSKEIRLTFVDILSLQS